MDYHKAILLDPLLLLIYINDILQYNCVKYILEYTATAANSLGTIIGLAIATIIIMQMLMQLIIVQLHTA